MAEKRTRMDNLDFMKAYGILAVISLHVPLWNTGFLDAPGMAGVLQYALRLIAEGVPIFITINGFLLLRKKEMDLKKHIRKMGKILLLLLVWCVILATTGLLLDKNGPGLSAATLLDVILNTQVGAPYTGVLWFLQNLLGVYLIFPVLWILFQEHFPLYRYLFWIVSFFVPGLATLELLRDVIVSFGIQETKMTAFLSFINRLSPVGNGWYLFYFMLGGMLWHKMDRIKEYRARLSLLGGLSWIVAFAIGYEISRRNGTTYNPAFNYGSIFMIAFVVGMFAFTLPFQKECLWKRLLASVGQNTFGMYFTHFLFIFVLSRFWDYSEGYPRLLAYGIVVVGSYLLTLVMQKIPYVRQLIAL